MISFSSNQRLLYAITLNWNRKEDTLACLSSFLEVRWPAGWEVRVLLVDNGSTDDTVTIVQAHFPQVEVLAHENNLGFARGANSGLRHALKQGADALFLFNNDTLFDPEMGAPLLESFQGKVAAVSPAIFYTDPPTAIWSVGGGRHPWTLEMTGNHGRSQPLPTHPFQTEFLTGCALLFRREALQEIGLFDEQFFMYYEDSDWSLRARQAGWALLVAPGARMWHKEAQSSGGVGSASERYQKGRASLQFFRKHAQRGQWLAIIPFRLASALKSSLQLARRGQSKALRAYWRGLWHGLRDEVHVEGVNCAP
ncbi:MAG: glycosyltransferase family 2 protein [Ardenticatenales bacterium]|nr:glycosyltransferase family 2 protein [Ardenticatenales bacterium]